MRLAFKTFFCVLVCLGVATVSAQNATAGPGSGNAATNVFDVRQFGAKGDGREFDTVAIQKALDECGRVGGGMVRLSAGTYLSKPIFLRSNTILQIDEGATLRATDEPGDYAIEGKTNAVLAFINGEHLASVAILGPGTIDGAGLRWWGPAREAKRTGESEILRRPRLIRLSGCTGVSVRGVTLVNSPSYHLVPSDCTDVFIEGVTIRAPADSPNTDGIDPVCCRQVHISMCVIDTGDDNIAIKSGHRDAAHPDAACENITVIDCTFLHGHGMSIGSETLGGVRGVTVQHCTFADTTSGIRVKSGRDRGGLVENLSYSDITMKDVKIPINIACYYPKIPVEDTAQAVAPLTPIYRNIRIANVTATSPQSAGVIVGLPESVVSNVVLENVSITAPKGLTIRNARAVKRVNATVKAETGAGFIIQANAVVEGGE